MMMSEPKTREDLVGQMIGVAQRIVHSNILTPSLHANMTARLPGERTLVLASDFDGVTPDRVSTIDLDANVTEGDVAPNVAEVLHMHADLYLRLPHVNCVMHTHTPYATAFAVARRPMEPVIEILPRLGITKPIPVTDGFQPRGSEEAIAQILEVVEDDTRAVLLANHGLLVFGTSVMEAAFTLFSVEENAQMILTAAAIGGAKPIQQAESEAAIARGAAFEAAGAVKA